MAYSVISRARERKKRGVSVEATRKSDSEPSFLKRVLKETIRNDRYSQRLLVVVAVHAVILEAGFVLLDKVSGMAVGCSKLLDQLTPKTLTSSLRYTLPEIVANGSASTKSVLLRFQYVGHLVNVYGSLSVGSSGSWRVCFDKFKVGPALELMLAKSNSNASTNSGYNHHENEVFKLWKIVRYELALPLLFELCEKAELCPPYGFMGLPTELQLKILEYLHGVDIAKMACTCSKMRDLSSDNVLWKQKFEEEYGHRKIDVIGTSYKGWFAHLWASKKHAMKGDAGRTIIQDDDETYAIIEDPKPFDITIFFRRDYDRPRVFQRCRSDV